METSGRTFGGGSLCTKQPQGTEMGCLLASRSSYRNASEMLTYLLKTVISPSSLQRMVKRFGAYISTSRDRLASRRASWESSRHPSSMRRAMAYGCTFATSQRQTSRGESKGCCTRAKKRIGSDRFCCENKVVMTQIGGPTRHGRSNYVSWLIAILISTKPTTWWLAVMEQPG